MTGIYALYLPPDIPGDVRVALASLIDSNAGIEGWWNHLPGLYLLASDSNAQAIAELVGNILKPWSFLVMRVDAADLQGWMPERGWPWIMGKLNVEKEAKENRVLAE